MASTPNLLSGKPTSLDQRISRLFAMPFRRREHLYAVLALVPALILYALFTYYPLFQSILYSFTDWNGYSKTYNFVGIANFLTVFREPETWQAFGNTFYFAIVALTIGFPLQLFLALLLSGKLPRRSLARATIYIPSLFNPVIVALTWVSLLQFTGVFNEFFRAIGLTQFALNWLGDIRLVKNALILINLWQFTGVGMVILLAGITAIPAEITELARLDGAVGWTLTRQITIPLIMPAITVNLLIGITGGLRLLELPLIMTKGGPRNASETVMMSIYNNAFGYERYGVASAMGLLFFAVIASITAVQIFLTRRNEVQCKYEYGEYSPTLHAVRALNRF